MINVHISYVPYVLIFMYAVTVCFLSMSHEICLYVRNVLHNDDVFVPIRGLIECIKCIKSESMWYVYVCVGPGHGIDISGRCIIPLRQL